MTTLVGRECWHLVGTFTHGKIIKQSFDPDSCTILTDEGEHKVVASCNVLLTLHDAIQNAEESVWYWERQLRKLHALHESRDDIPRSQP